MNRLLHAMKHMGLLILMLLAATRGIGQNKDSLMQFSENGVWPMPGAKWTYCLYNELGEAYDKEIWQATGDSLIGNNVYDIIQPVDSLGRPILDSKKMLLTRYENDSVFRFVNDKEYLFFPFRLNENDVFITFRSAGWGANGTPNFGIDSACCSVKPLIVIQKQEIGLGNLVLNEYVLKDTLFTSLYGFESEKMYWKMVDRIGPIGTYPFIDIKETGLSDGSEICVYQTCYPYALLSAYEDDHFEQIWFDCHPTSIAEDLTENEIKVYPNPTTGVVCIEGIAVAEILVYNSIGNMVKGFKNTNVFNIGTLPKGLYVLRINDTMNIEYTTMIMKK